jgi:hypothetical protein
MVKILISSLQIICVAIALISCEQKPKRDEIKEKSSQRIKSIMESIHDPIENAGALENQLAIREGSSMIKFAFNPKGYLLAKSTFDSKGNLEKKITYKYTAAGDTLETAMLGFNETPMSKWINKFDSQRRLEESTEVDARGKVIGKRMVKRTSDDTTRITTYSQMRGELVRTKESYIHAKNSGTKNLFFSNGKVIQEESISYDDRGNKIEMDQFFPLKKERSITQYKYDQQNNNIETIIVNSNLMITSKVVSHYDKRNNIIETLIYGIMGRLEKRFSHAYEYDEFSRWTKHIVFESNKPVSVTIHRIEYY